jgi:hypothetical protein
MSIRPPKKEVELDSVEIYPLSPKIPHPGHYSADLGYW